MKVIIPILKRAIDKCKSEIIKLNQIIDAEPLVEIVKIRQEAQNLLKATKQYDRTSKKFLDKLQELSNQEKVQWSISKKQKNLQKYYDKRRQLMYELNEYEKSLFYYGAKKIN